MNDVVFYEQPSKYIVESTEYDDKYTTPVLTPGKSFILGYTKETKGVFTNIPTIIFDDFTTESKYVDFVFKVKSSAMKILNCSNLINIKFIYYLLQVINIDTTTHKRHWLSNYEYMIIPIPCKKIQDKIVNRIESLFDRVNEIDNHYNRIDRLKSVLKSKIIDLAIKGELTKQLSTDEPSSKLIENIIEEKHKLMAEGKIKKENLSIIYKDSDNQFYEKFDDGKIERITDSIPFELPENWCWTRLRSIVYNHGQKIPDKTFSYIDIGTLDNINHKLNNIDNILESGKAPSRARKIVKYNDILYATVRPYLHNICIIDRDFLYEPIASTGFAVLSCLTGIYNRYLFIMLLSTFFDDYVKNHSQGVSYPAINDTYLYNALIPLPPKEEQKRIVSQIQQLLIIIK